MRRHYTTQPKQTPINNAQSLFTRFASMVMVMVFCIGGARRHSAGRSLPLPIRVLGGIPIKGWRRYPDRAPMLTRLSAKQQ